MGVRDIGRRALSPELKQGLADLLCSDAVGRVLGRAFGDRIPRAGLRFHVPSPPVSPCTRAQIFWGIYESAEIRFARRFLGSDLDVIELGASLGVVSCELARILAGRRRLVSVEANPELLPIWEENLRCNAPGADVRLLHGAIDYGAAGSHTRLSLGQDTSASRLGDGPEGIEVPATTLSQILAQTGIREFALVCDIEGAEAGILLDDAPALAGCRRIVTELHSTRYRERAFHYSELALALEALGFSRRAEHGPVYCFERASRAQGAAG
jgi:FkbM family methyltransferase